MVSIGSWNARGLNSAFKQHGIRLWIDHHKLEVVGLLETRIMPSNFTTVQAKIVPPNWNIIANPQGEAYC